MPGELVGPGVQFVVAEGLVVPERHRGVVGKPLDALLEQLGHIRVFGERGFGLELDEELVSLCRRKQGSP